MRTPERPTTEILETTESESPIQNEKSDLVKERGYLLRRITVGANGIEELIHRRGSRTVVRTKMEQIESACQQCKKLDKRLLELFCREESKEALSKEDQSQTEYLEKMKQLQEKVQNYLEERRMEPPSLMDSVAESVTHPDEITRERTAQIEETVRGISAIRDPLEKTHQTRSLGNVCFRRVAFQTTMAADRSTAEDLMGDNWMLQAAPPVSGNLVKVTVPNLNLEPFNRVLKDVSVLLR